MTDHVLPITVVVTIICCLFLKDSVTHCNCMLFPTVFLTVDYQKCSPKKT